MGNQEPFVIDSGEVEWFAPPHHENSRSKELVNPERGSEEVVFRISRAKPGAHDTWHSHEQSEQLMYFTEGEGTLLLGEPGDDDKRNAKVYDFSTNTFVYIPRDTYHQVEFKGDEEGEVIIVWAPPYESFDEWSPDS